MTKNILCPCLLFSILLINGCGKKDDTSASAAFAISPATGSVSTLVTITGTGFGATPADNVVKFNGNVATIVAATSTVIAAYVPDEAGTGTVTVTANGKTQTGPVFTYTEPKVTMTYFASFKAAGKQQVYQVGGVGYQACGNCACATVPPLATDNFADFNICFDDSYTVEGADILAFSGKTFNFSSTTFPVPSFDYTENGVSYSSSNVADQTGSTMTITKVESDGSVYMGQLNIYKITGTFVCKVAQSGQAPIAITEGTFVIDMGEN